MSTAPNSPNDSSQNPGTLSIGVSAAESTSPRMQHVRSLIEEARQHELSLESGDELKRRQDNARQEARMESPQ